MIPWCFHTVMIAYHCITLHIDSYCVMCDMGVVWRSGMVIVTVVDGQVCSTDPPITHGPRDTDLFGAGVVPLVPLLLLRIG